jgi:hypothetical protein
MILIKRVGNAFKGIEGREWALLTLETLGVVAGILIAFWLNEWASRRDAAAKHHEMMERLLEENETDISVLRDMRDTLRGFLRKEQDFAMKLAQDQCPPDSEFAAVTSLLRMPALSPPRAVHDEMTSSGGLSSIPREDVREGIAQYYGDVEWVQRQIDYFRAAAEEPVESNDARIRIRFDPSADNPEATDYDGKALCRDQAFKNRIASATRNHTVYVSYFETTLKSAISMCVRVADSLGTRCSPKLGGPLSGEDAQWARQAVANMHKELATAR